MTASPMFKKHGVATTASMKNIGTPPILPPSMKNNIVSPKMKPMTTRGYENFFSEGILPVLMHQTAYMNSMNESRAITPYAIAAE